MIRKVLILSTWFVLAVTFPLLPPYFDGDTDIFNYLEKQVQLKLSAAPKSTAALDLTRDVKLTTALDLTGHVEMTTALNFTGDAETTTALNFTGDAETTTARDFIGDVESTTYVYLEDAQTFELSTDVKSNTPNFVEAATEEAIANVTGDYLEELMTRTSANEADSPLAVISTVPTITL